MELKAEPISNAEFDDTAKEDVPPKRGRGRPPGSTNKPKVTKPTVDIKAGVEKTVARIGVALIAAGALTGNQKLYLDGQSVTVGAEKVGIALDNIAARDPKVKALLEKLFVASGYGELLAALMAIAVPVMVNHEIVPYHPAIFAAFDIPIPPIETEKANESKAE